MNRHFWVGRWLFHVAWSNNGVWTITKEQYQHNLWLHFGPYDCKEGRAWVLAIWRFKLMFVHA